MNEGQSLDRLCLSIKSIQHARNSLDVDEQGKVQGRNHGQKSTLWINTVALAKGGI